MIGAVIFDAGVVQRLVAREPPGPEASGPLREQLVRTAERARQRLEEAGAQGQHGLQALQQADNFFNQYAHRLRFPNTERRLPEPGLGTLLALVDTLTADVQALSGERAGPPKNGHDK